MGMQSSFKMDGLTEVFPGFILSPTGGKVMYVHASGASALSDLPPGLAGNPDGFFLTIDAALNACRTGRGDKVIALQGHTENIGADAFASLGTKTDIEVVALGQGTNRAALTWTAAGSTMLFDAANFKLRNFRLFLAGAHAAGAALTVAAPITGSAAGGEITDCDIFWGFDVDQIVAIGITLGTACDSWKFNRNRCYARAAAVPTTTFLRLNGCDQMEIDETFITGPGSTVAIGPVQQLTTACLDMLVTRSKFQNTLAVSTHAFTAIAGCTGMVDGCGFGVLAAGNGLTTGSGLQVTNSWTAVAGAAGVATTG
jgi:hypothetical protein